MAAGLNLLPQTVNGLLKLDLSNQGLTSIPEEVFDITDLEVLDVSNNELNSIPEAIGRLQKLSRLDAYSNLLTSLPQAIGSLQNLQELYVHSNNLSELPDGLEALQNLERLFVRDNKLTKLPTKMFSCLSLVTFDASNNKLSTLPPGVEKLRKLTFLCIDDNQLREVAHGVCLLSNLEVLGVGNNKLSTFPLGVEKLQKLRELYIYGNQLTEVPSGVCSLPNLEVLSVFNNKLSTFPPGVEKLQKLRELAIRDNQLTEVPSGVCSLPNLELLNVGNNKLSTFPPGVEKLQKLRALYINGNQLTEVPSGVCSLPNLEVLSVGKNPIRRLPNDVTRLTRLKSLDVHSCQFDEFPRQVLQLKTLEKLYAGQRVGQKFDMVPDEVGNLQHLWLLALENNLLRTLPSTMSRLHNLREVHLDNNKFDTFPEVLCELPAMEKLDIRNNITRLPTALHRADKLKNLDVSGTPLTYPPQDVCKQGTGAIMAFLKQEAEKDEIILRAFNRLSVRMSQTQWKPLARSLGLSNRAMDAIKASAPDDVPDQVYQTLVQWREKEGEAATLSALEQHLRDLDFQRLAEQLSPTHRSPTRRGHESEERGAVGGQLPGEVQRRHSKDAEQGNKVLKQEGTSADLKSATHTGSEVPIILLINDEYGTSKGGVSTINCQVGQTMGASNAVVYATALRVPEQDQEAANRDGVQLIKPRQVRGDKTEPSMDWLTFQFRTYYPKENLPPHVDIVIGHAHVTDTAARNIKDEYYKQAELITITHVLPEDTDYFRGNQRAITASEKEKNMLDIVDNAKAAFSVGPRIYKHFEPKYKGKKRPRNHFEFLPRPSKVFEEADINPGSGDGQKVVLCVGRVKNVEHLKGYNLAARSISMAERDLKYLTWIARGISEDDFERSLKILEDNLNSSTLIPTLRPYGTQEDIRDDMMTAHLVLMPSRSEPFGLVGLEAIAAGIPVLISDQSGLADMIKKFVDEKKFPRGLLNRIVETSVRDRDMEDNAKTWALKIRETLTDTETAFSNAKKFKAALLKSRYWEDSQNKFLQACGITGSAAQAQSSK